jgi:thiol:disulfide interchange protein DsbD
MGFLLLGTVIWLLFILSKLTEDGVVWTLISMLFCYFYFWLRKIVEQSKLNDHAKRSWKLAGLLVVVISVAVVFPKIVAPRNSASSYETDLISWQPYSEELVDTALANGQIAFIDFTADWCITCKANEKLALQTEIVANSIKTLNIAAFKADWTTGDERITSSLNKYGAKGVPHYVIIKEGEETTVLPTLLTPNTVVEALANAVKKN